MAAEVGHGRRAARPGRCGRWWMRRGERRGRGRERERERERLAGKSWRRAGRGGSSWVVVVRVGEEKGRRSREEKK